MQQQSMMRELYEISIGQARWLLYNGIIQRGNEMNREMKERMAEKLNEMLAEYIREAAEHEDSAHAKRLSLDGRINDFLIYWAVGRGLDGDMMMGSDQAG